MSGEGRFPSYYYYYFKYVCMVSLGAAFRIFFFCIRSCGVAILLGLVRGLW